MAIQEIREFNRFYTNLIGALDYSRHLHTPFTLTEARVLYELAHAPHTDAADLRVELSIDAGHLSRMLAKFEQQQLVTRGPSQADARRQRIELTSAGREAAGLLEERSQEAVGALVGAIPPKDRTRLTEAMHTVQDILREGRVEHYGARSGRRHAVERRGTQPASPRVTLRAPRPGDLGWTVEINAAVYAEQFGWNEEYEALVARIVADYAADHDPVREAAWIAELDGRRVGCVFCMREKDASRTAQAALAAETAAGAERNVDGDGDEVGDAGEVADAGGVPKPGDAAAETARLRLLVVDPAARGHGVGSLLVQTCIDFARAAGYRQLVLWTNDILTSARRIYQEAGFELVAENPHRMFGHDLVGQDWRLPLDAATPEQAASGPIAQAPTP